MRELNVGVITEAVRNLCIEANYYLGDDIKEALEISKKKETWKLAEDVLDKIIINSEIACKDEMPICQDTGMACVFMEIGQDVHLVGGKLEDAINEGVRRGYEEGYLRKSVVGDPIERINTKDNTPAIIYYDILEGDKVKITLAPKGFGSENMSKIGMLKPSDGIEGVKKFILETVKAAGPNPCPPMVIGVGIGGTFDKALLEKVNKFGIGPQGFGGRTTALGLNIEVYPTHIAGLPVAVNINCHATRHKEIIL